MTIGELKGIRDNQKATGPSGLLTTVEVEIIKNYWAELKLLTGEHPLFI